MFDFIGLLRSIFGGEDSNQNNESEQQNDVQQEDVNAYSGDNVRFAEGTEVSPNYANTLNDVVDFYRNEFNISPHATIYNEPQELPGNALGGTISPSDTEGQYHVNLRHAKESDEAEAKEYSEEGSESGFHPKNSSGLANTPVHEFGHAVYSMLFPQEEEESDTIQPSKQQTHYENSWGLVDDALKDMGLVNRSNDDFDDEDYYEKADENILDISRYAIAHPHETVAEALTDYYYNRDNSADLTKAIVNRLKSRGYMYGLEQEGGVGKPGADNFIKNLRRYRVLQ